MSEGPVNLLELTQRVLEINGKSPADVLWVGSSSGVYQITWEEFAPMADREYDPGYGHQEVAIDLVVVGEDWWMERHEYAGKEWWEFKTPPRRQPRGRPFRTVFAEPDHPRLATFRLADLN